MRFDQIQAFDDGGPVSGQDPDYDYASAQAAGVQPDARGHLPDTYKLPNHITFSDESIYHGKNGAEGGQWTPISGSEKDPENQRWMFTPGKTNLETHTPEQMQQYFQQYEPKSTLNIPQGFPGYARGGSIQSFDDGGDVNADEQFSYIPPRQFNDIQPQEEPEQLPSTQFNQIQPQDDQLAQQPDQPPQPGPIGAAVAGAAPAAAPITAAIMAGTRGAAIGAEFGGVPGAIVGGLGAGLVASGAVGAIQDWLRKQYGPSTGPLSQEYEQAAAEQQPLAYNIGRAAPIAGGMTVGNVGALARAVSGGAFGAVDVLQQGIEKGFGNIDPTEALTQAAAGAILPKAREWAGGTRPLAATTAAKAGRMPDGDAFEPGEQEAQQAQGQRSAPFNTSNAAGTSSAQPAVPGASTKFDPAAAEDSRFPNLKASGSERLAPKPDTTPGQTDPDSQGIPGAQSVPLEPLGDVPSDVAAALGPEQTPTTPAAPVPPTGEQAPGPALPQGAQEPAPPAQQPVQQPSAAPTSAESGLEGAKVPQQPSPLQPGEATPSGLEGQVPRLQGVIGDAITAAEKRPVVEEDMPSIANAAKDIVGPDGQHTPVYVDRRAIAALTPPEQNLLKVHESVEGELEKQGLDNEQAHKFATMAERQIAERDDIDWDAYSKKINDVAPEIENQPVTDEMRARWQQLGLASDPMTDIGHHTNKNISDDLKFDLNSPDLTKFENIAPEPAEEAPPPSEKGPIPGDMSDVRNQPWNRDRNGPPRPQSLSGAATPGALLDKMKRMFKSDTVIPESINPDPHEPASPAADAAAKTYADSLYDKFNRVRTRAVNATQDIRNFFMKAPEGSDAEYDQIARAYTKKTEDQLPDNLKAHYKAVVDGLKQNAKVGDQIEELDPDNTVGMDERHPGYLTRWLPRQRDGIARVDRGDDVLTGRQMFAMDDAVKPRAFKNAIELDKDGGYATDGSAKVTLIKDNGDGTLTAWQDGKPTNVKFNYPEDAQGSGKGLDVGQEFTAGNKRFLVDHADAHDIMGQGLKDDAGQPLKYNTNALTAVMRSTEGLQKVRDTLKLFNEVKASSQFPSMVATDAKDAQKRFGGLYQTNLPQFAERGGKTAYYPQNVSWALNDFFKPGYNTPGWLDAAANGLIKTMYVPGFAIHDLNEATQWAIGRGQRWAIPSSYATLVKTFPQAVRDVNMQGPITREIREAGGNTQLGNVLNETQREEIFRRSGQEMIKESTFWKPIADKLGTTVPQLAQDTYNASRKMMWRLNDYLYTQQYLEFKQEGLSPADAVKKTEEYISNYRLNGAVMGSRTLAKLYSTPGLSLFGRFNAGLWRSWGDMAHGIAKGDPSQRREAIGQLMAAGVIGFVIKPYVLDPIAQKATGNPDAEFGPRGMLNIPSNMMKTATGKQGYQGMAHNIFTPSLPISAAVDAYRNQDWTGKPIIPQANLTNPVNAVRAGVQGGEHLARTLVPPYGTVASAASAKGATPLGAAGKVITDNLGIKNPSEASRNYMNQIDKNNARTAAEHKAGPLESGLNKIIGAPPKAQKAIRTSKARSNQNLTTQ